MGGVRQVTHKKQKGKKKVSLELFRVKEPGVALEMLEIEPTPVRDFAWEPAGHRFAIIHGEDAARSTVSEHRPPPSPWVRAAHSRA